MGVPRKPLRMTVATKNLWAIKAFPEAMLRNPYVSAASTCITHVKEEAIASKPQQAGEEWAGNIEKFVFEKGTMRPCRPSSLRCETTSAHSTCPSLRYTQNVDRLGWFAAFFQCPCSPMFPWPLVPPISRYAWMPPSVGVTFVT